MTPFPFLPFFLRSNQSQPRRPAAVRPQWLATAGWLIACVGYTAVATASLPGAWLPGGAADQASSPASALEVDASPKPVAAAPAPEAARLRSGCQTCGVVERVRVLDPVGTLPPGLELTVRFRDGSTRISSDPSPGSWRVGDSVILMGGASEATP